MEVTSTLGRKDILIGSIGSALLRPLMWGLSILPGLQLATHFPFFADSSGAGRLLAFLLAMFTFLLAIGLLTGAFAALRPSLPGLLGEHRFRILPAGLEEATAVNTTLHPWPEVAKVHDLPIFGVTVFLTSGTSHVLPRAGFRSAAERQEFVQTVRRLLGKPGPVADAAAPPPPPIPARSLAQEPAPLAENGTRVTYVFRSGDAFFNTFMFNLRHPLLIALFVGLSAWRSWQHMAPEFLAGIPLPELLPGALLYFLIYAACISTIASAITGLLRMAQSSNEAGYGPCTVSLIDAGIKFDSVDRSTLHAWPAMTPVRVSAAGGVTLATQSGQRFDIPRRAFTDNTARNAFIAEANAMRLRFAPQAA